MIVCFRLRFYLSCHPGFLFVSFVYKAADAGNGLSSLMPLCLSAAVQLIGLMPDLINTMQMEHLFIPAA